MEKNSKRRPSFGERRPSSATMRGPTADERRGQGRGETGAMVDARQQIEVFHDEEEGQQVDVGLMKARRAPLLENSSQQQQQRRLDWSHYSASEGDQAKSKRRNQHLRFFRRADAIGGSSEVTNRARLVVAGDSATDDNMPQGSEHSTASMEGSSNRKKRCPGPVQPGAYGEAPGERPTRNESFRNSALTRPSDCAAEPLDDEQSLAFSNPDLGDSPRNSGLVEATAIQSGRSVLAEADEFDPEAGHEMQRKSTQNLQRAYIFMGFLVAGLVLIVLVATGVFSSSKKTVAITQTPSLAPARMPSAAPTPYLIPLPDYTIQAIETSNPISPQYRAYQWLIEDPLLENYPEARRLQRYALATFYYATNGLVDWELDGHWLSYGIEECQWYSKHLEGPCDEDGNYVALVLTKNDLSGSLPPELELLSRLEVLDVATNAIGGSIASHIGLMTLLRELVLDVNHFSGSVPTQIGQLSQLQLLYLHTNQITGTIPTELGLLREMVDLQGGINLASGKIPSELGLLTRLTHLHLSQNALEGTVPSEIYQLTSLSGALGLDRNPMLTGSIQTQIGLLTQLKYLFLQECGLTGTLPSELGLLKDLHFVFLQSNEMSGTLPTQIGGLLGLDRLLFSSNSFTGPLPSQIGLLGKLTFLIGDQNKLSGALPSELGTLPVEHMLLSKNDLAGSIPSEIGLLPEVAQLFLDGNKLSGPVPSELGGLTKLEGLSLNENELTGTLPREVGLLQNLHTLYFDFNKLNGTLPTEIGALSSLINLHGNHNQLTGPLPSELGKLLNLARLNLSANKMGYSISSSLFANLGQLSYLELANNPITGTIPSDISGLSSLGHLILEGTNLDGSIPTEIGLTTNMVLVALSRTGISGHIPSQICELQQLEWLTLHETYISGNIPKYLPSTLNTFTVTNTSVSGIVPENLCGLSVLNFECSESLCGCKCAC